MEERFTIIYPLIKMLEESCDPIQTTSHPFVSSCEAHSSNNNPQYD